MTTPSEEEYIVEKILNKRIVDGRTQYLLKWNGYSNAENSWEPVENLACSDLIADFEGRLKKRIRKKRIIEPEDESGNSNSEDESEATESRSEITKPHSSLSGFGTGRVPKEILGVTDVGGSLKFLMNWEGCEAATFVLAKEANIACPQLVIDFYEANLKLEKDGGEKNKKNDLKN